MLYSYALNVRAIINHSVSLCFIVILLEISIDIPTACPNACATERR